VLVAIDAVHRPEVASPTFVFFTARRTPALADADPVAELRAFTIVDIDVGNDADGQPERRLDLITMCGRGSRPSSTASGTAS
jgi:hypothetical protein